MNSAFLPAFLPELVLLAGALGLFAVALGDCRGRIARNTALLVALAAILASVLAQGSRADLFSGAYRVDAFSQLLKTVFACGLAAVVLLGGDLPGIRDDIKSEYYLFVTLSVAGLTMLVSCVDIISLIVALELSSFPLYLLVPMRREREGQRSQMESAIKYVMFGVAANGIMLFGLSYLFGLTGTTHLAGMAAVLGAASSSPLATAGLAMAFCGLLYKLAIFPFHFWTPDVYQGASNETAALIASLPKLGAVAVLIRFVSLATPDNPAIALLLAILAAASMSYGNLVALVQKDLKRMLGFSGIAQSGYALVGLVALNPAGYTAAMYYIIGYILMILACFTAACRVSPDGSNVAIEGLAGLHRRSPLLAATLFTGIFALAGLPPFVGFMGKLGLLTAVLARGHLWLVIVVVVNSAVAIYYYLQVIRQAVFGEPSGALSAIRLSPSTRLLCAALIAGIVLFGAFPETIIGAIGRSLAFVLPGAPVP
ncbi:MAG: NADH-quinone oxidoreductase subunit N [Opitutaceae bacterium]|jgi:NADH-quinone oxidoreductase subunit N